MKVEVARFEDLNAAKTAAKRAIDDAAELTRRRYLTPGAGQAMEYEAVVREAERRLAGKPGAYPMLQSDVDAGLASDLDDAATLVMQRRSQWETVGAAIRSLRLARKRDLDGANTQAMVAQIREQAKAELDAL